MGVICFSCLRRFSTDEESRNHTCRIVEEGGDLIDNDATTEGERPATIDDPLVCRNCGKRFVRKYTRCKHEEKCQQPKEKKTDITRCGKCFKTFSYYTNRLKHEKKCTKKILPSVQATYECISCDAVFHSQSQLAQHAAVVHVTASGSGDTHTSSKRAHPAQETRELTTSHNAKRKKVGLECRKCTFTCDSHTELYNHRQVSHYQSQENTTNFQDLPWTESEQPPWINEDGTVNDDLKTVYNQHKHLILKKRRTDLSTVTRYNYPVTNTTSVDQLSQQIEDIYSDNTNAFKVNMSFGIILVNTQTGLYRYFTPYYNENVFDLPLLVSDRDGVSEFRKKLTELDIINFIMRQRPDTKFKPVMLTNVVYTVYSTSFVLGCGKELPSFIVKNRRIIAFERNHRGKIYEDQLCLFRCLAHHRSRSKNGEKLTRELYEQWLNYVETERLRSAETTLSNIYNIERCFGTIINIYSLQADKSIVPVYKSEQKHGDKNCIMYLNLYEDHLSYITNFATFSHKYRCKSCSMMFATSFRLRRHVNTCKKITKLKFPGGYFKQQNTIFDKLNQLGISVQSDLRTYPWFAVFDMEAVLTRDQTFESDSANIRRTSTHKPVCVSICSNVTGYEKEKFILNENTDELLKNMILYLLEIDNTCSRLATERWSHVLQKLSELETKWGDMIQLDKQSPDNTVKPLSDDDDDDDNDDDDDDDVFRDSAKETNENEPPSAEFLRAISKENVFYRLLKTLESSDRMQVEYNDWNDHDNDDDDDDDDDDDNLQTNLCSKNKTNAICSDSDDSDDVTVIHSNNTDRPTESVNVRAIENMLKKLKKIRSEFESYCNQLPVIGFNSGKYDINLCKEKLVYHLKMHEQTRGKFVVKKCNNYLCLANENFRFLDLINYLPPGSSYDSFLATFNVQTRKSYFPYEYFDVISKLDDTCLPPKEKFYSSLKKCNVLENRKRVMFDRLVNEENNTVENALKVLQTESIPSSAIDENYNKLQKIWVDKGMQTMRDFLQYYSELDVGPMVQGIEKFQSFFFNKHLDIFKQFISIPGVARKMLYDSGISQGASFSLIDKRDEDLYHTYMRNITGGPSIVFTRKHVVGETYIRSDDSRVCNSIYGYDCNAMYLWAVCLDMCTGRYIRRKHENKYKPDKRTRNYFSMFDWMNWLNHSENKNIRHKMNNGEEFTVGPYFVDGYDPQSGEIFEFLGDWFHGCPCMQSMDENERAKKYNQTIDRIAFIRSQGFKVNCIWECEYRKLVRENEEMKLFIEKGLPSFYKKYPNQVTREQILAEVVNDGLFGFVEVDIQVPDSWDQVKYKPSTNLTPYEYFEEMSPIFCTTEVPFDSIGDHMKTHAKKQNLSQKPRIVLVGGMKAENILLLSPLLRWYILHGLLISKVHQVIEYSKMSCFKQFGEQVTQARRIGDHQPENNIMALLMKLIGNSAFGGTIMNKERHRRVRYYKGLAKAGMVVNNPRFECMTELDEGFFEAQFKKIGISIDNPLQIGLAILNYAKLHMLSFYYDFMDTYIERLDFEYIEVDTDSAYFALSKASIKDVIKPEMKQQFEQNIYGNCRDNYNPEIGINGVWFPRECCHQHRTFDIRTPGLMKIEFEATRMIGLCSKSYVAKSDVSGKVKYSLKGVNKVFADPTQEFQQVLSEKTSINASNSGIGVYNGSIYTYHQSKKAFTYFYCKRNVCEDGIHTKPLNICMTPVKKQKL